MLVQVSLVADSASPHGPRRVLPGTVDGTNFASSDVFHDGAVRNVEPRTLNLNVGGMAAVASSRRGRVDGINFASSHAELKPNIEIAGCRGN